jgi:monothiol glutaredoxin
MQRPILEEARIHPAIRPVVSQHHRDIVEEVEQAISRHAIVVVGMSINPAPKQARKLLDAAGLPYHYLEYGSYLNNWRRRNALKMWTGWPTFPMIFVNGSLIGGASDLSKLLADGSMAASAV